MKCVARAVKSRIIEFRDVQKGEGRITAERGLPLRGPWIRGKAKDHKKEE